MHGFLSLAHDNYCKSFPRIEKKNKHVIAWESQCPYSLERPGFPTCPEKVLSGGSVRPTKGQFLFLSINPQLGVSSGKALLFTNTPG